MMATIEENNIQFCTIPWPSEPKQYQWKGTISEDEDIVKGTHSWYVLAHCKPRKEDVFIKIRCVKGDEELDEFTKKTTKLINVRHPNLMTPVHAFVFKSEIFVVFPRHSGGRISEIMETHYPNGISNEKTVACILYDTALGLQNLHKHQQVHRNIKPDCLHIDIDEGITLLSNLESLKEIKFKEATKKKYTKAGDSEFTDPYLGVDENASWYTGDVYAFGITALQLTYGAPPPINRREVLKGLQTVSTEIYDRVCPFNKAFELLIKECCGPIDGRLSAKQLVEHKFFKGAGCPNPEAISQELSFVLKSLEKRINSEIEEPPPSMKQKVKTDNDENELDNLFTGQASGDVEVVNGQSSPLSPPSHHEIQWTFGTDDHLEHSDHEDEQKTNYDIDESDEKQLSDNASTPSDVKDSKSNSQNIENTPKTITNDLDDSKEPVKEPAASHAASTAKSANKNQIQSWMEEHNVFEQTLYDTLIAHHVETAKKLKGLKQQELDGILKEVRMARLAKIKDKNAQKEVETELVKFEKLVQKGKKGKEAKSKKKKTSAKSSSGKGDKSAKTSKKKGSGTKKKKGKK